MSSLTDLAPNVPLKSFKRTKIIATLGPATDSYESILALIKAGANGLRLNFSHGNYEERERQITWIRKASKEYSKPVAIIQDLQGPKIRLGDFDGIINVKKGETLRFAYQVAYQPGGPIPIQYDLSKKVKRGDRLYLFDGKIRTRITAVKDEVLYAEAENNGILIKRKGINLPDTDLAGDIITDKDRKDITYGSTHDIDYVALSFVQDAQDIETLRRILKNIGSDAKIIAKIETKAAVDNLEAIVQVSDAVMIARGDLAIETEQESVPTVQRQIVGLGLKYAKPTIVATQLLASMTDAPDPTRAEVSDVATSVLIGADCLMLSDETANGRYPIDSVKIMKRVIRYTENNAPLRVVFAEPSDNNNQGAISRGVISLAEDINAQAIVAETLSGATALQIAVRRSKIPLIAVTSSLRTAHQLSIVYGVKSYVRPANRQAAMRLATWLRENHVLHKGDVVIMASGRYPGVVGTTDTIKIRVLE